MIETMFGKYLKEKRTKAGLPQSAFGIHYSGIFHLESGRNLPTYQTLLKIAKAFKMPTWEFIKEFEEKLNEQIDRASQ